MKLERIPHPAARRGFTLIELVVTAALVSLLATLVFPTAQVVAQRSRERDLRDALRQLRSGIDAYKQAVDEKRIIVDVKSSGYPPNLQALVDGVTDAKNPNTNHKMYFLRRVPRDPMNADQAVSADASWGKRSYASPNDVPREGDDVYDVYSRSEKRGLNGIPYQKW
jgi:general secretion pathway protein G